MADTGFIANIPTTGTDLYSATTCVETLWVSNTSASNITVTLRDKTGTPNVYTNSFVLAAGDGRPIPLGGL